MTISEITANDLAAAAAAAEERGHRIRIVDVREHDEWIESHIPWAEHVVLGTVPDRLDAFGPDGASEPTYVICKAGGRSMRACEFAGAQGKNVINVAGGMMAWWDAGHVAVTGV